MSQDRKGKRVQRTEFKARVPALGRYIIFTDTEDTEEQYLYGLRDSIPQKYRSGIAIKVLKARTGRLVSECRNQLVIHPQFCEPWIVFDRDEVPDFDNIIEEAGKNGIKVGWSNPCLEIWFGAYFGTMDPDSPTSQLCRQKFRNVFRKRTGQEYRKSNPQNYNLLARFGDEDKAITLAEKRLQHFRKKGEALPSRMCPGTTLHHLVAEIRRKTKP